MMSLDAFQNTKFPKFIARDTPILTCHSRTARRTDTSQPSKSSATTTTLSLSMKYSIVSTNSLLRTEQIVAQRDHHPTTGPLFKSDSHRLSSQRSRSGMTHSRNVYSVLSYTPRTVQLFWKLDMTGLNFVARPTRCILKMESESSATNREATPNTSIMPGTATSS